MSVNTFPAPKGSLLTVSARRPTFSFCAERQQFGVDRFAGQIEDLGFVVSVIIAGSQDFPPVELQQHVRGCRRHGPIGMHFQEETLAPKAWAAWCHGGYEFAVAARLAARWCRAAALNGCSPSPRPERCGSMSAHCGKRPRGCCIRRYCRVR